VALQTRSTFPVHRRLSHEEDAEDDYLQCRFNKF